MGKQRESVAAIVAEANNVDAQLQEVRREVRERTLVNSQLSKRLGLERENQARSQTQEAVLASVVSRLHAGAGAGSSCTELAILRAQIATLAEENAALQAELGQAPP